MSRRLVSQLAARENIDQVFLASEKQLRANRNGDLYLQIRLADKSGSVTGMMWNAKDSHFQSFENGDYVQVKGTTQMYNGSLQMIVNKVQRIEPTKVDEADFITLADVEVEKLASRVAELLRTVRNVHLRNLSECFLSDERFMAQFTAAPAGVKNHHAYKGGLLDHVVSLMELVAVVAPRYRQVDSDLLMVGAFLHDLGKITELTYERDLGYSDEGQMIGHLVIGVTLLQDKIEEAERLSGDEFPHDLNLRLQHMIVSHHGTLEFGSPKLPMTLEAIALHYLDTLDAKLHHATDLINNDPNPASSWTPYHANISRKLYKGESSNGKHAS